MKWRHDTDHMRHQEECFEYLNNLQQPSLWNAWIKKRQWHIVWFYFLRVLLTYLKRHWRDCSYIIEKPTLRQSDACRTRKLGWSESKLMENAKRGGGMLYLFIIRYCHIVLQSDTQWVQTNLIKLLCQFVLHAVTGIWCWTPPVIFVWTSRTASASSQILFVFSSRWPRCIYLTLFP